MSMKLKTTSFLNTIMKRTKVSVNVKNSFSIPDACKEDQEFNLLDEKVNLNKQNSQDQKINQINNSNCNIIESKNQSKMNIKTNQDLNFPVRKKLNFKNLKKQLIAADSNTREENKNKFKATVDLELMKDELKPLEDPPTTPWEKNLMASRLPYSFFDQPCEQLAQNLLGKILVRRLENGTILKGRIIETESYLGIIDKASHTYQYRVSARNLPMYMSPGTIYVYFTYGMYYCFNLSTQGDGCAVLIRALDPIEGLQEMIENRNSKKKSTSKQPRKEFKSHELCNGPSKICMSFLLNKDHSKYSICSWKGLWIEEDNSSQEEIQIVKCKRIGIESCGSEWANKPLRYYIYNNKSVSKRDKGAEATRSK